MTSEQTTATVTIGGHEVTLARPDDYVVRTEVWELGLRSMTKARGAALGLCWRGLRRPETSPRMAALDIAEYGASVWRELCERGLPKISLLRAGNIAYRLITDGLITGDDLEEAEGNSGPETDSGG